MNYPWREYPEVRDSFFEQLTTLYSQVPYPSEEERVFKRPEESLQDLKQFPRILYRLYQLHFTWDDYPIPVQQALLYASEQCLQKDLIPSAMEVSSIVYA